MDGQEAPDEKGLSSSAGASLFATHPKFLLGIDLAPPANPPYPGTDAGGQQAHERAKQWSRPLLEGSRPQADDPASIGHAQPGDEGVTQAACRAKEIGSAHV